MLSIIEIWWVMCMVIQECQVVDGVGRILVGKRWLILSSKEISVYFKVQKLRVYLYEEFFWVKLKRKKSKFLDIQYIVINFLFKMVFFEYFIYVVELQDLVQMEVFRQQDIFWKRSILDYTLLNKIFNSILGKFFDIGVRREVTFQQFREFDDD